MKKKKSRNNSGQVIYELVCHLFVLLLMLTLTFSLYSCGNDNTRETSEEVVTGVVVDKEYVEEYSKWGYYYSIWDGEFKFMNKHFPPEYNVTVQYDDLTLTRDNSQFFNSVEIGDPVKVVLKQKYVNGEITERSIRLKWRRKPWKATFL